MSSHIGALYEARFIVRALEHMLEPHPCAGDYMPYDFLVTNAAGKVFKTQVKGTGSMKRQGRRYSILAATGRSANKVRMDCSKVDILAAYMAEVNTWYIVPCMAITSLTMWFYPTIEGSRGKYEKYREAWNIFKDV